MLAVFPLKEKTRKKTPPKQRPKSKQQAALEARFLAWEGNTGIHPGVMDSKPVVLPPVLCYPGTLSHHISHNNLISRRAICFLQGSKLLWNPKYHCIPQLSLYPDSRYRHVSCKIK